MSYIPYKMNRKSHIPECCPLLSHHGVPALHTDYISRLRQCVYCGVFPENMLEDSSRSISLLSLFSVVPGSPTLPGELCLTCALLGHPVFLVHQPPQLGWLPQQGGLTRLFSCEKRMLLILKSRLGYQFHVGLLISK